MTIIPKTIQKPFRYFEIICGAGFAVAGLWLFVQIMLWLTGETVLAQPPGIAELCMLCAEAVYLSVFGVALMWRGYISIVLWVIALSALASSLPMAVNIFSPNSIS